MNLAEERHADSLDDVAAATHTGVHEHDAQQCHSRYGHANSQAKQDDAVALRRHRRVGAVGTVDNSGIVVGHGLRQGVFLTPVEQEEVERLLYLLLALDGQHLALLGRH